MPQSPVPFSPTPGRSRAHGHPGTSGKGVDGWFRLGSREGHEHVALRRACSGDFKEDFSKRICDSIRLCLDRSIVQRDGPRSLEATVHGFSIVADLAR
eukprot:scaffold36122_cov31-Tisochrysis_lutea.AAC.4